MPFGMGHGPAVVTGRIRRFEMYKALVACKAGMGSSMMLKIKADQVIKENELPKIGRAHV